MAVECWEFTDPARDDFTTYGNLASKAYLGERRLNDTAGAHFTQNLWSVILNRMGEHTRSSSVRSKAFAVLVFYADGEIGTVTIRHATGSSGQLVAGEAEILESQIPIEQVRALEWKN